MLNKLYINSEFDCLCAVNNQQIGEIKGASQRPFIIKLEENEMLFQVYPIINCDNNQIFLPLCAKINLDKEKNNNQHLKLIKMPNNIYDITLTVNAIPKPVVDSLDKRKIGEVAFVINKNNTFEFESPNLNIKRFFKTKIKSHSIFEHKNDSIILKLKFSNNTEYLFIYFKSSNNFYELIGDESEILGDRINLIQKQNDIAGHVLLYKYKMENQTLKMEDHYISYEGEEQTTHEPNIIPFAFFEAIKVSNFKVAKEYLSPNLSDKLSPAHLKKFFPGFQNIKKCYESENIFVLYDENNCYYYKIEQEESLISNIIEYSF